MRAVDTNVIVRRILQDDPEQAARARELLDESPVWVSLLVLKELFYVLQRCYHFEHTELVKLLRGLLDAESVVVEDAALVEAALARWKSKPRLGFFDCLILELSRARGNLPLMTFDRSLAKEDGAALL